MYILPGQKIYEACSDDNFRPELCHVLMHKGQMFASDGHIFVQITVYDCPEEFHEEKIYLTQQSLKHCIKDNWAKKHYDKIEFAVDLSLKQFIFQDKWSNTISYRIMEDDSFTGILAKNYEKMLQKEAAKKSKFEFKVNSDLLRRFALCRGTAQTYPNSLHFKLTDPHSPIVIYSGEDAEKNPSLVMPMRTD